MSFTYESDLELRNVVTNAVPDFLREKGITAWCKVNGVQDPPRCVNKYQGENYPGEFFARNKLSSAYNGGYRDGFEGTVRVWRSDAAAVEQMVREGTTRTEIGVSDLGYVRGTKERAAATPNYGGPTITRLGKAAPKPTVPVPVASLPPGESPTLSKYLLPVAALGSVAVFTVLGFLFWKSGR
jgi:hypothetical protein